MSRVQAIRGATTLDADTSEQMLERVEEMMSLLYSENGLVDDDVVSAWFTATPDVHSMFPPGAARATVGMTDVPMMGATEMAVDGALGLCIRVMLHVSTSRPRRELRHVYLRGAIALRPDLTHG